MNKTMKVEGPLHVVCQCDKCKAQPEQEPLAWISTGTARMIHWTSDKPAYGDDWVPLYITPPQRTWVGLTDEDDLDWEEGGSLKDLVKAIETKLKEKNTRGQE